MKKNLLFVALLMVAVAGMTVFEVSGADAKKREKNTGELWATNPFVTHIFTADPSALCVEGWSFVCISFT